MLEVKDGETLVAVHLILRRSIDEQCAILVACLGVELDRTYGAVRNVGTGRIECSLVGTLVDFDGAGVAAHTEEGVGGRIGY